MSAVFEIPVQLALILQLAAVDPSAVTVASSERQVVARPAAVAFGYSEARWFDVLHRHGASAGQGRLAARIFRTRSGLVYVPDVSERMAIAAKRTEAAVVLPVARQAAAANAFRLSQDLGRTATAEELLLAHLASHTEAMALISAASDVSAPDSARAASEIAPEAALALPVLFFAGTRARTVLEVQRHIGQALLRAAPSAHRKDVATAAARDSMGEAAAWRTITVK